MKNSEKIVLELFWIPPAILRGNSRGHWRARAAATRDARRIGRVNSRRLQLQGYRIEGPIQVKIESFYKNKIDLDNLLIGYKPIIDGIADTGIIDDDRNIKEISIKLNKSKAQRSVITILPIDI